MPAIAQQPARLRAAQKKQKVKRNKPPQPAPDGRPPNVQRINPLEQPIEIAENAAAMDPENAIVEERPRSWWKRDS